MIRRPPKPVPNSADATRAVGVTEVDVAGRRVDTLKPCGATHQQPESGSI